VNPMRCARRWMVWAAILTGLIQVTACRTTVEPPPVRLPDPDRQQLNQALESYADGEFADAAARFEGIWLQSGHINSRAEALHGLACSRFALAQGPAELSAAWALWQQWRDTYVPDIAHPDPRLYGPILEKYRFGANCPSPDPADTESDTLTISQPAEPPPDGHAGDEAMRDAQSRILKLQRKLRVREEEARNLRNQMARMETALRALKDQIAAIEEIHQEINEKKKGIQQP